MKFSEIGVTVGWHENGIYTSKNKLEYFNTLMAWCIDDDEGMKKIDYRMKRIYEVIFALQIFYGIEFDTMLDETGEVHLDGMLTTYDEIKKITKIDELILRNDEIGEVLDAVEWALEQEVKVGNSLEKIIRDGLDKLLQKVPNIDSKQIDKWMKQLPKALDKISPENREILKKAMEQNKGN